MPDADRSTRYPHVGMDEAAHEHAPGPNPDAAPAVRPDPPGASLDEVDTEPIGPSASTAVSVDPVLSLSVEAAEVAGFAGQQHGDPVVRAVVVTNIGDAAARDVEITARLENGVSEDWSACIDAVAPGGVHRLEPIDLRLSAEPLARQTERERTDLVVQANAAGHAPAMSRTPIDVLAADEWGGVRTRPELLAAFVLPNHPAIEPVLARANELLLTSTGSAGLDGYQSRDPARARRIAEAGYVALLERGIGYINPPASFEREGQRVRLADRVLGSKLGTCLDLSLLLAAVWEQSGLHPVVVVLPDHAFVGVWTRPEHFADAVLDSGLAVRKRAELGEVALAESTLLTHGADGAFPDAERRAFVRLAGETGPVRVIDIRASRKLGVRPLPVRVERTPTPDADAAATRYELSPDAEPTPPSVLDSAADVAFDAPSPAPSPADPVDEDRLSRWKRRLLDLSLRNRLINFKSTRRTLPLFLGDADALEDRLAGGGAVELHPRPDRGPRDEPPAYFADELRAGRVRCELTASETERRGTELFRDARAALDETGANLLHLAIGTLVWRDAPGSEPHEAPLLLIPVTLERPGGGRPLRVTPRDEPARPNAALLEKLRVEFAIHDPALGELPEDERGVDVAEVLRRFREAVKTIEGWEVREAARLGLFSFSRFLMWRDLEARAEDLRRSDLVRRLLDEDTSSERESGAESGNDPGAEAHPANEPEPLVTRDADASQAAAVRAAARGETFVLQGPPGTGKSQTIANMIADALARGERVLFVAEKRAALSVVRRRLERDGLGPFCLELHSSRASKRDVLDQLAEALDAAAAREPDDRDAEVAKLASARERLDEYVRELHEPRASGESVREVIARLTRLGDGVAVRPPFDHPAEVDAESLATVRNAIDRLVEAGRIAQAEGGDLASHPLRGVRVRAFSFGLPSAATDALRALETAALELGRAAGQWLAALGVEAWSPSAAEIAWIEQAGQLLERCPGTTAELIEASGWNERRAELARWVARVRARDEARAALLARYDRAVLALDLPTLSAQAARAAGASGLRRWWGMRSVRTALKPLSLGPGPDAGQAVDDLAQARFVVDETAALAAAAEPARCFAGRWSEGAPEADAIDSMLRWADETREHLSAADAGLADAFRDAALDRPGSLDARTAAFRDRLAAFRAALDEVDRLLDIDPRAFGPDRDAGHTDRVAETARRWAEAVPDLGDWCVWSDAATESAALGLGDLVERLGTGAIALEDAADAFERSFARVWLTEIADRLEGIRGFTGRGHNQAIRRFAELDERVLALTRELVRARLASAVPPPATDPSPKSEIGVLRRQLELKRRHLPIRQLIERIPETLARLKPCFLMSPLSIAQYLDPALPPFDLVVFDEASQIPPWEAIGAIARGSRVVVVGDTKQLPPTSFFEKAEPEDDETASEAEELESILQECVAAGLPTRRLLWHYRSRHDSLIAFSNERYYDGRLRTFPAPAEPGDDLGVSFRRVEGVYDRGSARTNRVEAEAVVDELARVLLNERLTVGVVCFNLAQQVLIEDLFDERCRRKPALDTARDRFEAAGEEPVFVKNLESVQGDERDVILFSVTYGPDADGRMPLNFGPLNRDGGERRLNVAVTRARRRVVAFASFDPERIDETRTAALGVRDLRRFLERARDPQRPESIAADPAPPDAIARAVRAELADRGHALAERVGSGGSRVALAVRDPDDPRRYVLGIEFDGPGYANVETARDRDRIRPAVMAGLGWRLHRVWSPEWHLNREGVLRSIDRAIADARRAARRDHAPRTTPLLEPQPDTRPDTLTDPKVVADDATGIAAAPPPSEAPAARPTPAEYTPWFPGTLIGDRDTLMDDGRVDIAIDTLAEIVAAEAPIVPALAVRRLAEAFGVERLVRNVRERCETLIEHAERRRRIAGHADALWPANAEPDVDEPRRPGPSEASRRALDDIPLVERVAAVRAVLREQVALPDDDLAKHAARLLGTQRLTDKSEPLMRAAIDAYRAAAPE